jgi:hypothetical protein
VAHVHAQGDLGLPAVASEVSFAGKQAEQVADGEITRATGLHGPSQAIPLLFHRQVPRGTSTMPVVSPSC